MKYTPPGGSGRVGLDRTAAHARVWVEDTGPGIPEAEQARIFERFYMAAGAESDVQPGTGLGLALARELTELHAGTLAVESRPGVGSRFVVTLPLVDAPVVALGDEDGPVAPEPVQDEAIPPPAADEDRACVLVVDDNADIRSWLRGVLGARYQVLEAPDGVAALRIARANLPDLVITDLIMPVLDGLGLVRGLRADPELDWLPIVLLTARGSEEDQVNGLERGADVYLTKPFSSAVLLAQVEGLLHQRERLRLRFGAAAPAVVPEEPDDLVSADARYLQKIREAVHAHLSDPDFGVQELADAVHQDRSHLFRRMKELTGDTPSALLREERLLRGASLIEARAGNISEIAYAVGFRSVAHFSTAFRERFGQSPTAWVRERG